MGATTHMPYLLEQRCLPYRHALNVHPWQLQHQVLQRDKIEAQAQQLRHNKHVFTGKYAGERRRYDNSLKSVYVKYTPPPSYTHTHTHPT